MNVEPGALLLVLSGTLVVGSLALIAAHGPAQRLMLVGLLGGLAFYSGIGSAAAGVPRAFMAYYFGTFVAIIVGFYSALPCLLPTARSIGNRLPNVLADIDRSELWALVIPVYVTLSAFPLLWPEFRLHLLFAPPLPNLREFFALRFTAEPDVLSRMIGYARLLLTPFFYLALYRLRHHITRILFLFAVLLYLQYVANAYLGRGFVMLHLVFVGLAAWYLDRRNRRWVLLAATSVLPVLLFGFYIYARVRIGGSAEGVGVGEAIASVLAGEWGFPRNVGVPIIGSGSHVDLGAYLTWIGTLPIPKLVTGPIAGARVNYEISEIVLGLPIGAPGWYVVLPGLVAESVYIFGRHLFWLHGLSVGVLAAVFVRFAERVPQFFFFFLYVVLLFAYVLNRAGVAALLPRIMNEFVLFYVFLAFAARRAHLKAPSDFGGVAYLRHRFGSSL